MSTIILPKETCKGPRYGLMLKMLINFKYEDIIPAPNRPEIRNKIYMSFKSKYFISQLD